MKGIYLVLLLMLSFSSLFCQKAQVIKISELQKMMNRNVDTTFVINFMATWCQPCMEELPYFEKVSAENKNTNIKFIYVSLDALKDVDLKLNRLIERRKIYNKVYLLDETDYNSWINKIEKSWDGAIPVTFIINNSKKIRRFIPNAIHYQELTTAINKTKQNKP